MFSGRERLGAGDVRIRGVEKRVMFRQNVNKTNSRDIDERLRFDFSRASVWHEAELHGLDTQRTEKVHPGTPWNWSRNGIFGGMLPCPKGTTGGGSKESPAASLPATDEHLWRTVDRAIPSEVASQPPQATSDRMIPRNRRLGYLQLRRWVVKAVLYVVLRARFSAWSREFA